MVPAVYVLLFVPDETVRRYLGVQKVAVQNDIMAIWPTLEQDEVISLKPPPVLPAAGPEQRQP
jgi:hypothetical protein